jgi:hypothetical protein
VGHELGHALSACEHTDDPTALMYWHLDQGVVYDIDESSLTLVCTTSDCPLFNPESSL